MLFVDFAFLDDRASRSDFPILSGNFFLGAYSLAGFVVEHAAAGNLDIRLRQKCPFAEYQVYVVVGLAFVVVECADALLTTPEWLTGLSEDKEYDGYTKSKMKLDEHLESFLKEMDSVVGSEAYQQFLAGHLCNIIDLYSIYAVHFARAMKKADEVVTDEGLKESLIRYAIESGVIVEQVYQKEMEPIIEDMKRYMDGLLHIYDKGKGGKLTSEMFRLPLDARNRLEEGND